MQEVGTFEELQAGLTRRLGARGVADMTSGTVVVLPSISFAPAELRKITGITRYEERLLCLLLLLDEPELRMIYLTALPVDDAVIDYYLSWLDDPAGARARLTLISLADPEARGLTEKLLDRPEVVEEISLVAGDDALILPFNVTAAEREFSERTGIALYGPAPHLVALGTKTGSRQVARRAGVPVLEGTEDVYSAADLETAIARLKVERPDADSVVVKLNHGFSGQGNAIIELADVMSPLSATPTVFCAEDETWETYLPKLGAEGGIVEEHVRGVGEPVSPSVQLRISPSGTVEVVSTHDQILGGPDGQVYLGCRFPARREYRDAIQHLAERIGHMLAAEGVIGSFGIDFIVVPTDEGERVFLSEINLRMGGTTHPFLMAKYVTGGEYDESTGELTVDGAPVAYVATDNLKSESFKVFSPARLIEALRERGLFYDPV
ncbi:MAG: ATP-grasp domain-containing protein, partial [Actinomycetota bacterium]